MSKLKKELNFRANMTMSLKTHYEEGLSWGNKTLAMISHTHFVMAFLLEVCSSKVLI